MAPPGRTDVEAQAPRFSHRMTGVTLPLLPGPPEPRHCQSCGRPVPKGPLVEGLGSGCAREHGITAPSIPRPRTGGQDGPTLFDLLTPPNRKATPVTPPVEQAACRQRTHREDTAVHHAQQLRLPDEELHARVAHPDWEYTMTEGPRKQWDHSDMPPDGGGWVRNVHAGRNGWERFDYTEESYWMRPKRREATGG